MSERACRTCIHFRPYSNPQGGDCHRYPPSIITYDHPAGRQFEWVNPQVYDTFLCGEWTQSEAPQSREADDDPPECRYPEDKAGGKTREATE